MKDRNTTSNTNFKSADAIAQEWCIPASTVRQWCRRQVIPCVKIGKRWLIDVAAIREAMKAGESNDA
jgi:hypothetical protein